jgi:hypothetical protein
MIDVKEVISYCGSMDRLPFTGIFVSLVLACTGCVRVQTEPIRIEPIYIEITINHRVQEELDSIFADIDAASATTEYAPLEDSEQSK